MFLFSLLYFAVKNSGQLRVLPFSLKGITKIKPLLFYRKIFSHWQTQNTIGFIEYKVKFTFHHLLDGVTKC